MGHEKQLKKGSSLLPTLLQVVLCIVVIDRNYFYQSGPYKISTALQSKFHGLLRIWLGSYIVIAKCMVTGGRKLKWLMSFKLVINQGSCNVIIQRYT